MAQRKPYNPNTKYGRRKLRQQAAYNYSQMTPEEKSEHDFMGCVFTIIILVVIGGMIYLVAGPKALMKWLSH